MSRRRITFFFHKNSNLSWNCTFLNSSHNFLTSMGSWNNWGLFNDIHCAWVRLYDQEKTSNVFFLHFILSYETVCGQQKFPSHVYSVSFRYMFIGGTNFGYWNGECLIKAKPPEGRGLQPIIWISIILRCQLTVRRTAHKLRLRFSVVRGRGPHREILCYPRGHQHGANITWNIWQKKYLWQCIFQMKIATLFLSLFTLYAIRMN